MSKFKVIMLNLPWFALLSAAYVSGWLDTIAVNDPTYISAIIAFATALTVFYASLRLAFGTDRRAIIRDLSYVENAVTTAGLIGTVLGLVISLLAIDPNNITDASQATTLVASLIKGMGIGLCTTLTGCICYLWLYSLKWLAEKDHGDA